MINQIFSLTKNGLRDWFFQRLSAVILLYYFAFLLGYFIFNTHVEYYMWAGLFSIVWFKWFTILAFLSLMVHAWIGIWTVFTDYIKCAMIRTVLMVVVLLSFIVFIIWAFQILWS